MMKKRITSLVLVLAMCMTLCVPAFATVQPSDNNIMTESQLERELSLAENAVWEDLYNQLNAQDALGLYEIFQAELRPKIAQNVYAQLGIDPLTLSSKSGSTFYFPNGGYVSYENSIGAKVLDLYMTTEDTKDFLLDNSNITVRNLLIALLGFYPGLALVSVAGVAQIAVNVNLQKKLKAANYFSEVIDISAAADEATFVYVWENHPYGTIPDRVSIIHRETF